MVVNICPPMPLSCSTLQSLSRGTRSYAFFKSTKHAKTSFAYFQDFSKICFRVKIWSVELRFGQKPPWPKSYFSIIFTLFTISFLIYRNDHTCLPVVWCFLKHTVFFQASIHVNHPCQPAYSFSIHCL